MKSKNKQYWMCMIGPGDPNDYPGNGADGPLRHVVRESFNGIFGPDKVCSSGWGIDEERYQLLRNIHAYSTEKLKRVLSDLRTEQLISEMPRSNEDIDAMDILKNFASKISTMQYGEDGVGLSNDEINKLIGE